MKVEGASENLNQKLETLSRYVSGDEGKCGVDNLSMAASLQASLERVTLKYIMHFWNSRLYYPVHFTLFFPPFFIAIPQY